jgi:dTDP-4-amino-4,6-dideoxygalactose transaminase
MTTNHSDATYIPLAYPRGEIEELREKIAAAIMKVVDSNAYILGPEVSAFEQALANSLQVPHAIGVASGTDALALGMLGLGVGPGDEVITVSHTAGATVAAVRMIGAVPVLVDVNEDSYCLDPVGLHAAISARTKAIIAVHLYGHPADIDAMRMAAPGVPIIEDCAQAQGALSRGRPVGSLGDVACFSFYPTKNLGALGDGGAVVSGDKEIADRIRRLRAYGWTQPQFAELPLGRCSRLDEIQAAVLSLKLQVLPANLTRRRAIAARYRAGLSGLPLTLPTELPGMIHAYHLFVLRTHRREELERRLTLAKIGYGRHYPLPVHRQPGLAAGARIPRPLTVTDRISGEILSLPMFSTLRDDQVDTVIAAVKGLFS